jgi:hypothetical protein
MKLMNQVLLFLLSTAFLSCSYSSKIKFAEGTFDAYNEEDVNRHSKPRKAWILGDVPEGYVMVGFVIGSMDIHDSVMTELHKHYIYAESRRKLDLLTIEVMPRQVYEAHRILLKLRESNSKLYLWNYKKQGLNK